MTDPDEAIDELVVVDVGGLTCPDLAAIDALARLELNVRRHGRRVRLQNAGKSLEELLCLAGLSDVVLGCEELPVDPRRQAEEREQRRLEKVRDVRDQTT